MRTRLNKDFAGQLVKSSMRYTQKKRFERIQKKTPLQQRNILFKKLPPFGECGITKKMYDDKISQIEDDDDSDYEEEEGLDEFDSDDDYDEESGGEEDMINYSTIGKTSSGKYIKLFSHKGNVGSDQDADNHDSDQDADNHDGDCD